MTRPQPRAVISGSAAFVNWAAALEVAAANLLLYGEFLQEYLVPLAAGAGKKT